MPSPEVIDLPTQQEQSQEKKKFPTNVFKTASWSYRISRLLSKGIVTWVLISSIVTQVESIISISLYGYLINSITSIALEHSGDISQLVVPFTVYSIVTLVIEAAKFGAGSYIARIKSFAETSLKSQFIAKLLQLSEKQINEVYTDDEVTTALTDITKIYQQFQSIVSIFASAVIVIFVSVYLGQFSIWLPTLLLPLSMLHFVIDRIFRKRSTKKTKEAAIFMSVAKNANSFFLLKNGREQLRRLGAQQKVDRGYTQPIHQFNTLVEKGKRAWNNATKISNVLSGILAILILSVVLYYSPGLLAIGGIYVQIRLVNLLRTKFDSIFSSVNAIEDVATDVRKLQEIFQMQNNVEVDVTKVIPQNETFMVSMKEIVAPTEGRFGFNKLTWNSGSGVNALLTPKTHEPALLELILSARQKPLAGDITLSGVTPDEISQSWVNKNISFISKSKLLSFLSLKDQADIDGIYDFQESIFMQYLEILGMTKEQITDEFWATRPKLVNGKPVLAPMLSVQYLIARALYQQKKLIVVFLPQFKMPSSDEVLIMKHIKQVSASLGVNFIVFCSHVVSLLHSDHVAWLWNGSILESGETSVVFSNPTSKLYITLQKFVEQLKQKEAAISTVKVSV